jgi:DNA-binding transcriptional LysR family regulator
MNTSCASVSSKFDFGETCAECTAFEKDLAIANCDAVVLICAKLCRESGNAALDTEDLQTFVEVADAGGVTSAALRLGISKSMVSRRLVRLEADLGVQLLARTTRGASLTEAGATFRDYAARVCAEIEVARETILPAGELRGRLRVAAPLSFGPTHLAPILADMARRHPQIQIQTCYTDRFVDLVSEGYDCAIRIGYLQDSNLIARRVGPIYGKLVASPDYIERHGSPDKPEELAAHEALMQGTEAWQFVDGNETITVNPRGRFKADNAVALLAAAVAGLGIGYLPDGLTDEYVASGALLPIMTRHPPPPAGVYVVRPPAQHPARKVRVLTEMLIECFETTQDTKETFTNT